MELFDKVNQSPEGVTAAKLAEDNEWDEDATHRLLNGCVALKTLLKSTGQDGKGLMRNLCIIEEVLFRTRLNEFIRHLPNKNVTFFLRNL